MIGEWEVGEGFEFFEKNFEEFDFKCGYIFVVDIFLWEIIS